jgi:hypothetical protein
VRITAALRVAGVPGLNIASVDDDLQADANLLWGFNEGPSHAAGFSTAFRGSATGRAVVARV